MPTVTNEHATDAIDNGENLGRGSRADVETIERDGKTYVILTGAAADAALERVTTECLAELYEGNT